MGFSFGNKNFRMNITKNGIGYSAGVKGFRISHRANSKNHGVLYWIFILLPWYCIKYSVLLTWYCIYFPIKGIIWLCKWIYKKIKNKE